MNGRSNLSTRSCPEIGACQHVDGSPPVMRPDRRSVFGNGSKITLCFPVPPHAGDGILPPALHLLQRTLVGVITLCDHLLQMAVLRFYDLVSGRSMERHVARSTQLLAGHCFHGSRFLSRHSAVNEGELTGTSDLVAAVRLLGRSAAVVAAHGCDRRTSTQLLDADEVARGVAERAVTHSPGLGCRFLEHLGARRPNLLEGGVEVVGGEDRSLQRSLGHE